ncbi:MAG: hypothetical protein IID08_10595, partial [Candidatus Hydrogenedentes bacterium]|nr:hypothetical protein [Candidatus Hydrogenedentota bacterium]
VFTTQTPSGQLFRVDMRLRPHGRKGPLVMSISSTLHYYEIQGYAWERQALIKARPAAGDSELGQSFIEQARPFVFPRYFDDTTLEEIRVGKQRLEAQVAEAGHTEREVKLGRGGIRDIEFTVQMLQLLNGGRIPELRTRKSLEAIELLGRHDLLRGFEALALTRNYIFLRKIEHRLQIEGGRQIHVLPDDPEELQRFAHRFGFASADAFMREYRMRSRETRSILERFFAEKGSGNLWIVELLDSDEKPEAAVAQLKRIGFSDPTQARRELIALHEGDPGRPHSAHTRQRFREIAPALLGALAATPNPNATLMRLERMLMSLRAPGTIYDILKHVPELSESLATLISNSPYLADFIIQDPGLFETFGYSGALDQETTTDSLEKSLALLRNARDSDAALYRLRRAETLRIGMRDLLRDTDIVTVGHELSRLADLCVREALLQAQQKTVERFGPSNVDFAVLALGKLGGSELSYASDLDLVFIHEGEDDPQRDVGPAEYCATLASHLIRVLKEPTSYGTLYEIDTRLRPDGRRGPLSVSRARFESYFRDEAQAWERLAWVKVRGIAGTGTFAARAEQFARDCAFSCPLGSEDLHRIEEVRKRLAAQSSPLDLKRREGGIAEIEFAIRLLQLAHAADHPELKRGDALGALDVLGSAGLMSENEHTTLREAYLFLRRVENRIRMMKGRAESTLPSDANALRELGELLGITGDLRAQVETHASAVHRVYEAVSQRLSNPG